MVQVRNVPDDLHAALRARARSAGMSLSEFLLRELRVVAGQPTLEEVLDDAATHATGDFTTADVLTAVHDGRSRG